MTYFLSYQVHEENSSFSIDEDAKSGNGPRLFIVFMKLWNHPSGKLRECNHERHLIHPVFTGIATYVPGQKPEWKRYKQYTRNDIMAAIEAVKGGMSALQAARKYGVPSRTLYDKVSNWFIQDCHNSFKNMSVWTNPNYSPQVKKLGITTNRPYRKGSFPMSPYQGLNIKGDDAVNYMKHDDNSSYSPEDLAPLDISSTGNGSTHGSTHGGSGGGGNGLGSGEGDSDKMGGDSDAGCSLKQEHSPHDDELRDCEKDDSGHHIHLNEVHMNIENGSEICSSSSPRDRDPSEPEELRSASEWLEDPKKQDYLNHSLLNQRLLANWS